MIRDFADYGIQGIDPRRGGNQKTRCPKCSEGRKKSGEPCLSVNVDEGVWNCWHCGWSGSLKQNAFGYTATWQKPYRPAPVQAKIEPAADKVVEFFGSRKISREVLERNGVGCEERFISSVGKKRNCIAFPYHVGDNVVNVKYRDGEKNFAQVANGDKVFYKLNDIDGTEEAIICEGEIDALSFEMVGRLDAVSVPDGGINNGVKNLRSKLEYLDNCADWFDGKKKIFLATDTDAPGLNLRDELARRLGKERCWIIRFPEGCKDANEVLITHGSETLLECVSNAEPYPIEGISDLSAYEDELDSLRENGYPEGASINTPTFDKLFQFFPSQLTVVTGIPGHGKTTWCDWMRIQLARYHGWRWGLFSPENFPPWVHLQRLCEMYVGKGLLPTAPVQMTDEEFRQAKNFVRENFFYVQPTDGIYTIEAVLELAAVLVARRGIAGFEIDPFNKLTKNRGAQETDMDYINRVLRTFQRFAQRYGVHAILVAHPTKMQRLRETDGFGKSVQVNYQMPDLYSVSGSADFFNMTDNGIVVYRYKNPETDREKTIVSVQKVKFEYMGEAGSCEFTYSKSTREFKPKLFGETDDYSYSEENLPAF